MKVRFCPAGAPTFAGEREFERVPTRGEVILHKDARWVVVYVEWQEDGSPFLIAHGEGRPRARELLG